ncbi:hypothetical protein HDU79_007212 [Rhizoclosmatium sp. JEL0117]|nr:hypothetical protein HDU79_007212 [Rhizoclosmatium sp. JEL0117]
MPAIDMDSLLRELDASLDECTTGKAPLPQVTVAHLLSLNTATVSGLMDVISPADKSIMAWKLRFLVLTMGAIFMFESNGPEEMPVDVVRLNVGTEVASTGVPGEPLAFTIANNETPDENWILRAKTKTSKDTWIDMIARFSVTVPDEQEYDEGVDEITLERTLSSSRIANFQGGLHIPNRQNSLNAAPQPIFINRSLAQPYSSSPSNYSFDRRDSEAHSHVSSEFDNYYGNRASDSPSFGSFPKQQSVGIPGGGIFGSLGDTEPDLSRLGRSKSKTSSTTSGDAVNRKKNTKAQISKSFIQF